MPRNNFFQFKQFRIVQERSAMKVGMDGVLIGAWADASGANHILDIGTGTGLIALMMAQKNSFARIDAVEIDTEAFDEAVYNFSQSPWSNRILGHCCSFQEFAERTLQKYDLIVSNPPFFAHGVKSTVLSRSTARHSDLLPLSRLLTDACTLLKTSGKITLVLPFESLDEMEDLAISNQLCISRLCRVKPNPLKPEFRILAELTNAKCKTKTENLMIEFDYHHDYTPEYKALTREFYLKF